MTSPALAPCMLWPRLRGCWVPLPPPSDRPSAPRAGVRLLRLDSSPLRNFPAAGWSSVTRKESACCAPFQCMGVSWERRRETVSPLRRQPRPPPPPPLSVSPSSCSPGLAGLPQCPAGQATRSSHRGGWQHEAGQLWEAPERGHRVRLVFTAV